MRTQLIKGLPDRDFELSQVFNVVYLIGFCPITTKHDTNKYENNVTTSRKTSTSERSSYRNLPCISEIRSCRILARALKS